MKKIKKKRLIYYDDKKHGNCLNQQNNVTIEKSKTNKRDWVYIERETTDKVI